MFARARGGEGGGGVVTHLCQCQAGVQTAHVRVFKSQLGCCRCNHFSPPSRRAGSLRLVLLQKEQSVVAGRDRVGECIRSVACLYAQPSAVESCTTTPVTVTTVVMPSAQIRRSFDICGCQMMIAGQVHVEWNNCLYPRCNANMNYFEDSSSKHGST